MKPPTISILLSPEESEILSDTGHDAFTIITRATYPRDSKRWILHIVPIDWPTARHADAVLHGRMKASKIRTTSNP